jgi:hypothetical protein
MFIARTFINQDTTNMPYFNIYAYALASCTNKFKAGQDKYGKMNKERLFETSFQEAPESSLTSAQMP